jgi:acyl-coenzyme A synthetase/AMP-(fatty) acid ligase
MSIRRVLIATLVAAASVGAVTQASAQGLTREEVRQQLIEAEANGSRFVTDASYPDVSPVFAQQVARDAHAAPSQAASGMGMPAAGKSDAGAPSMTCVGPASYCNIYSGS